MKEIFTSFFESSNERIKNPLIGTFIISWTIINWKPIVILCFSNNEIVEKINLIESEYSSVFKYLFIP